LVLIFKSKLYTNTLCQVSSVVERIISWKQPFHYFYETDFHLVKKFFPLDKNYLLEQAQLTAEKTLLKDLIVRVKSRYEHRINPLGLVDSFTAKIRNHKPENLDSLHGFYENLCAIYRFKFGDNQLEFLWDGNDHLLHYKTEWTNTFDEWTHEFCKHDLFVQAILDLTVFLPENKMAQMIENRMQHFIQKHFEVKILHKVTGLRLQAANGS
jgi:hypothetical protein